MKRNGIYEDLSPLLRRARRIFLSAVVIFFFVGLYYWKVQIIDFKKFWRLAEANRTRELLLPAPRGLIRDRNGVILAENNASFKVSLIRENSLNLNESLQKISSLLGVEVGVLKKRMERYLSWPLFKPIVLKDNLSIEEVSKVEARKLELPELIIETEPRRYYPFHSTGAHVIGYLQEISQGELKAEKSGKRNMGDIIGKSGVEKEYESLLKGEDGKIIEIVDSLGRKRGEVERILPSPGRDIQLTLDFDLQQRAEELLSGQEGAVVILDAQSGEVLALASYPTFDPNKFITRFSPEEWMDLVQSPDFPLENRAFRGLYAPGSIFKLTMAIGSLDSRVITEETAFFCGGAANFYGNTFSCWFKPGHGELSLFDGLRFSCNIYFYNLGRRMGIERIARYAELLGFGKKTGIDLPGEKEGLVPTPEWKKTTRNAEWFAGETISVAIGQGPLLVTPLQVAAHTALIANRGIQITPYVFKESLELSGTNPRSKDPQRKKQKVPIPDYLFEKVIEGMWRSVNREGTGREAYLDGLDVCGKTGTTQLISSEKAEKLPKDRRAKKTHSWFSGFAPRDNPRVVVTVLVEYGGTGGATAAPLAKQLFEIYKRKYEGKKVPQ